MHRALPWLVVGGLEAAAAAGLGGWWSLPFGWAGATTLLTGVAYVGNWPSWLGKGSVWAWVMAPVLFAARGTAAAAQRAGLVERVEIVPGLWVGGWPRRGAPGLAQLDVTAELPRRGTAEAYACVPMLDGAPMREAAWRNAVDHALAWRRAGLPVLVHCAYGHGRSVAVVIGVLVAEGHDPDFDAAHARVRAVRPAARMTPAQRAATRTFLSRRAADGGPA